MGVAEIVGYVSDVGVIGIILFVLYLIVFDGKIRSEREFRLEQELRVAAERRAEEAERQVERWRFAYGNSVEALEAHERVSARALEDRSLALTVIEAMKQIAEARGGRDV